MPIKSLIPYYGDSRVREQIDKMFSREVLGAVLVGKFIGDYAAIVSTTFLGEHLGYTLGILISVALFIYWHKVARAAQEAKDNVGLPEGQSSIDEFGEE